MCSQMRVLVLLALSSHSLAGNFNRTAVSYIIKGDEADITEFPFLVFIKHPSDQCGGSLISAEWVVTAGHCVNLWVPPNKHHLRMGSSRHDKGGVLRAGLYIVRHEGYFGQESPSEGILKNDIALIKIRPVSFSDAISPVELPQQNQPFSTESIATTAGFGKRQNNATVLSPFLMKAKIPYLDTEECKTLMWERANLLVIPEMQICFGDLKGGSGGCNGDSGGPIVVDDVAVGMTSWGIKGECGEPRSPGVYVRMSYYRDWITQISGV